MVKRTTVMLDDDIYLMLVEISLKKYGTVKAVSKVLNELLKEALKGTPIRLQKPQQRNLKNYQKGLNHDPRHPISSATNPHSH